MKRRFKPKRKILNKKNKKRGSEMVESLTMVAVVMSVIVIFCYPTVRLWVQRIMESGDGVLMNFEQAIAQ